MNFNLNPEQDMLRESVRRFVEKSYSFEQRTAYLKEGSGSFAGHWQTFAANGWLAAALPEEYGGLAGTVIDTAIISHELGRGLVLAPYLGSAVLAAQTLAATSATSVLNRLLPQLADGSHTLALAYSEASSRGASLPISAHARFVTNGYVLNGIKTLVLGATNADSFIVTAMTLEGMTLFLVDARAPGVTVKNLPLHDGRWAADVMFKDVFLKNEAVLGETGKGLPALEHGLAHGIAAVCAEMVGAMERAIEISVDYVKVRKQFGVTIGSFQVIQHRLAEMTSDMELARSMLHVLLASISHSSPQEIKRTCSAGKALIGRTAKSVCAQAIQLHGGIGMTEEYAIGHYYKAAVVADRLLGGNDLHDAISTEDLQANLV